MSKYIFAKAEMTKCRADTNGKLCCVLEDAWSLHSYTRRVSKVEKKCNSNDTTKLQEQLVLFF